MKRTPPGLEIYRNGQLSVFEIDGLKDKVYLLSRSYCNFSLMLSNYNIFFKN